MCAEEEENLVFGYDAAGEGHGAALYAGVFITAVEVHVVGPVGVRHTTAAAKLRSQRGVDTRGERGPVRQLSLTSNVVIALHMQGFVEKK